jgi:hypothetical protein
VQASDEIIILPLPSEIGVMRAYVNAYLEQYGVVAHLQLRGSVGLEGGQMARIPAWRTIVQFDEDLGLVGLGELGEREEDLLWVSPSGPGELKIAALEEEN